MIVMKPLIFKVSEENFLSYIDTLALYIDAEILNRE